MYSVTKNLYFKYIVLFYIHQSVMFLQNYLAAQL